MRLAPLAVPNEHGGWSFLLEPIVLGLVLAASPAAGWLAVAAVGAFLARHPLRIAAQDVLLRARYPRTGAAAAIGGAYLLVALIGAALAWREAAHGWWPPLLLAAPLVAIQAWHDVSRRGRAAVAELAGAAASGASAALMLAAAGWSAPAWLALWAVLALRGVGAVLYVRARLRLERGEAAGALLPVGVHLAGIAIAGLLASARLVPWLAVWALAVLALRAASGLSPWRRPSRPQRVGVMELAYGVLFVAMVASGYAGGGARASASAPLGLRRDLAAAALEDTAAVAELPGPADIQYNRGSLAPRGGLHVATRVPPVFLSSSMAEHPAVNRRVAGSSPA